MWFLGIDPGVSGGWAVIDECRAVRGMGKTPATPIDWVIELRDLVHAAGVASTRPVENPFAVDVVAVVEFVRSSPQMGVVSAFTFGRSLGIIEGVLAQAGISHDTVRPQVWQRELGCLSRGDKNVTRARAQELFPRAPRITHATADAVLLAEYCRRIYTGRHGQDLPKAQVS